ncbi:GNAT family N-acetyltransferase [Williamsia soli]|uniref:GNAT family N-acetyltransferase n=1 Tax=Williamsia soli TaxID=364929 RepID=UPI001F46BAA6|nr:GNAT family N-acetyltransferase [Williamsia soli]
MRSSLIIETDRLVLRPVAASDTDHLVALDSDPAVMRYVTGGVATPREVIEEWVIPRAVAEARHRGGAGVWVALDRLDLVAARSVGHPNPAAASFVGWFGLRAPRHSSQSEFELSYRLRREMWGRGLATEGARALVQLSFTELNISRIFAGTMAVNTASRRVMEKSGLRLARLHDCADISIAGAQRGEVEYEILKSYWDANDFPWAWAARTTTDMIA